VNHGREPSARRRAVLLLAVVLSLAGGAACGQTTRHSGLPRGTVFLGPKRIALHVEIADTEAARQRGLMGRTTLAPDAGMAFLFDSPVQVGFYMKDTLIPLSITFWDQAHRVVAILDMVPCRTDPCPDYFAGRPFVGAVEANQGFFAAHGIGIGDGVELER
jgi:uncharacterized membrane protein (UPF0127 family)